MLKGTPFMKSGKDRAEKPSRRKFAKTIASGIIAAPAIASLYACKSGTTSTVVHTFDLPPFDSNGDPPVIIDGGSVKIDCSYPMNRITDKEFFGGTANHSNVAGIQVVTEQRDGFHSEFFPKVQHCTNLVFEMWLQYQSDPANGEYNDPPNTNNESNKIIFDSPSDLSKGFHLSSTVELSRAHGSKPGGRSNRIWHKHQNPNWDVRIAGWRLTYKTPGSTAPATSNANIDGNNASFRFMLWFKS
jgi:hypothetical protein